MAEYSRESYRARPDRYDYAPEEFEPTRDDQRRPYDDDLPMHPGYESRDRGVPARERYDNHYEPFPPRMNDRQDHYDTASHPLPQPPPHTEQHTPAQEPIAHQGNQLAPYDDEKAYAEWQRGEEEREAYYAHQSSPPPADYDRRAPPLDDYDRRALPSDDYDRRRLPFSDYDRRGPPPDDYDRRRPLPDDYTRHALPPDDYDRRPTRRHTNDRERGSDRRRDSMPAKNEKERDLAGALIGGGAGALLGHELIGKGPLGTIGGAVVGAIAAKGVENYEDKKRREKDEERRRIRREYDSASYDPRGSYRSSNFYDTQHASPAASTYDSGRYPPRRPIPAGAPRRRHRRPSSSSDSFTSDE